MRITAGLGYLALSADNACQASPARHRLVGKTDYQGACLLKELLTFG
jgi:hypothetical protein